MVETDILPDISSVDSQAWDRLVGSHSPFLEYGFLHTLEETGCLEPGSGWTPKIVVAKRGGDLVGAVPMYLKTNSAGEFVFDWSWAEGALRAGIEYYPKAVVAVPFTPVTGARVLVDPADPYREKVTSALVDAALDIADELELSSVHFNFILPEEQALFEERGLPIRQGIQYHWQNDGAGDVAAYSDFDDFLSRFRSKRRANIRRERRKLRQSGVTTRVMVGEELSDADMERMFRYYLDTVHKYLYGRQYLTREFFLRIRRALTERLHMVVARKDGEPFGAAFNLHKGDRLYGRYWGCEREVKFAHFEACIYRPVQWCIEEGVAVFEPGAGGEHKLDRGFAPTWTYSAHYVRDPALRRAINDFIRRETSALERRMKNLHDEFPLK